MIKFPTKTLIAAAAGAMAVLISVSAAPAAFAPPLASGISLDRQTVDVAQRKANKWKYKSQRRGNWRINRYNRRGNLRFYRNGLQIIIGNSRRNTCRTSYRKWQVTGSRYWRNRYYECRNG